MSTQSDCSAKNYYQQAIEQWKLGEQKLALLFFKKAVRAESNNAHYWYALAGTYHIQKKYRAARFCFEQSLKFNPSQDDIKIFLCEICYSLTDHKSVAYYARQIDFNKIQNLEILYKIACSFKELGQLEQTGKICSQILSLDDDFWQAKLLAAEVLRIKGYAGEAKILVLELIAQQPTIGKFWNELGINEVDLAHEEEALFAFSKAEQYVSELEKLIIGSNYLFEFSSGLRTAKDILDAHLLWTKKYCKDQDISCQSSNFNYVQSKDKTNIAYLSGDFKTHSVSYFIEGILKNHSRDEFNIILLSNTQEDEKTKKFKDLADTWIDLKLTDSETTTQIIKELNIDILVELSGHTNGNKLNILSPRVAPIQATYLGYFATTGLPTIDYWITDEIVHPIHTSELATETIIRLPRCYLAYTPPTNSPTAALPPAINNGYVTFGSFVASRKISDYSILLWSSILNEIPNSQLLIKNRSCLSALYRSELIEKFSLCGISSQRINFNEAKLNLEDHLAMYNKIDIALDTYPASGCTTTAEALWMGVPVLTRLGDLMVSRNSASLLHALNLQDWIAETDEEYIEKGVQFAQSIDQLALLRQGMRERFMQSELYDSQDLTRHLEDFYLKALQEKLSGNREVRL
ncbi:SPY protein [Synechococcus elongatus]|uniref:protein O-GlcNAc transferase n=1 Tax=Synechococcus elongatus PCC 11801 TaxID=2219813 RepID=A0AAN1QLL3_SYNEL|nr:SPY protein [Synechococcus elongatus]AZB71591.1 SPY protein [Synechococcus elongatus PCC 11801]